MMCPRSLPSRSASAVDRLAHSEHTVVISCQDKLNLDYLLDKIWEYLNFIRIYTKRRGKRPDFSEPLIMRDGSTVEHVCHSIHRELYKNFKYALVWGASAKHDPQRTGISHSCEDEDVVQIMTKSG
jgi:ribosome-interacting GTPase 1